MPKTKDIFTTGDAAEICGVSLHTIIRCFDSGKIEGFRLPGSHHRRISRQSLIKFMRENKIPMDRLESGKKRALIVEIVDDDQDIINQLVDILTKDGMFEIRTTSDGYEAGIMTQKFLPDLILLDYTLPYFNASTVCQTIKKNPEFEGIRVIIMSGVIKDDEINQLLKSGAAGFIRKPFTKAEIMDKVAAAMQVT